ncbi:MAG TPA: hypothetical protein VLF20_04940 [Patescibacteria group bacterium]|nr:hypothetical protein [Patescibacteria group bacterium]
MTVPFAKFISLLLNPLSLAIFAPFVVVYRTTGDLDATIQWTIYTLFFIFLVGCFVLVGVKKRKFSDIDVSKREQRPIVFFVAFVFSGVYLLTLFWLDAPIMLSVLASSIIVGIVLAYLINKKIKASMHVAVVTAFTIPVVLSFRGLYVLLLLLIPLIIWARLVTKRHTAPEVITGGMVGALLSVVIYFGVKMFIDY